MGDMAAQSAMSFLGGRSHEEAREHVTTKHDEKNRARKERVEQARRESRCLQLQSKDAFSRALRRASAADDEADSLCQSSCDQSTLNSARVGVQAVPASPRHQRSNQLYTLSDDTNDIRHVKFVPRFDSTEFDMDTRSETGNESMASMSEDQPSSDGYGGHAGATREPDEMTVSSVTSDEYRRCQEQIPSYLELLAKHSPSFQTLLNPPPPAAPATVNASQQQAASAAAAAQAEASACPHEGVADAATSHGGKQGKKVHFGETIEVEVSARKKSDKRGAKAKQAEPKKKATERKTPAASSKKQSEPKLATDDSPPQPAAAEHQPPTLQHVTSEMVREFLVNAEQVAVPPDGTLPSLVCPTSEIKSRQIRVRQWLCQANFDEAPKTVTFV